MMLADFERPLRGRSVFLTGHTGFTGSWLTEWLNVLDCHVAGYSLAPETEPNLFSILDRPDRLSQHRIANITHYETLHAAMAAAEPSIVLHLAAQPLVRRSFLNPLETFASNALGTAYVLEAARSIESVKAIVCVTTDKVYKNREGEARHRETDRLGGADPYSASKACSELVASCYQETMAMLGNGVRIATARGGNIIGGGDWSEDRIIPDFYRALSSKHTLEIRSPDAIRPWQHVLSACHGYLAIASDLIESCETGTDRNTSWNIGPSDAEPVTVRELVKLLGEYSPSPEIDFVKSNLVETGVLTLDTTKATMELGFHPPWSTSQTVRRTAEWYAAYYQGDKEPVQLLLDQLDEYRGQL